MNESMGVTLKFPGQGRDRQPQNAFVSFLASQRLKTQILEHVGLQDKKAFYARRFEKLSFLVRYYKKRIEHHTTRHLY